MKNKEILLDVIGDTDERLVPELTAKKKKNSVLKWTALGGVCAAAVFACVTILPKTPVGKTVPTESSNGSANASAQDKAPSVVIGNKVAELLAEAVYPEMPQYPDETKITDWNELEPAIEEWNNARSALKDQPEGYQDGFDTFFLNSTKAFLNSSNGENYVYSPLSLYMALGMSAEITDGESRQQILDALAQSDIETLRSHSKSIWQANYSDDGMAKCVLATSLWTNSSAEYKSDTVNRLADTYYSSVYAGDPASAEYNKMFGDWLNTQTDGLLSDQVANLKLDPGMIMTLASTVNYSGKWIDQFSPEETEQAVFHAVGGDINCDFMNDQRDMYYYRGDHFSSVSLSLENNGHMKLILPDEGYTPADILNDAQAKELMLNSDDNYENGKFVNVTLSVPKFDVCSKIDLRDGLNSMGITNIFDANKSDFTPLTDTDSIFLSKAEQDSRVTIDEEGCKAASMTVAIYSGGVMPDENAEFILDRPFIFEIMSDSGLPLFVGVVNNPVQ